LQTTERNAGAVRPQLAAGAPGRVRCRHPV